MKKEATDLVSILKKQLEETQKRIETIQPTSEHKVVVRKTIEQTVFTVKNDIGYFQFNANAELTSAKLFAKTFDNQSDLIANLNETKETIERLTNSINDYIIKHIEVEEEVDDLLETERTLLRAIKSFDRKVNRDPHAKFLRRGKIWTDKEGKTFQILKVSKSQIVLSETATNELVTVLITDQHTNKSDALIPNYRHS